MTGRTLVTLVGVRYRRFVGADTAHARYQQNDPATSQHESRLYSFSGGNDCQWRAEPAILRPIMPRALCVLFGLSLLHCGSDSDSGSGTGTGGSGGGSATTDYPTDVSESGIAAFVDGESYQTSTWTSETAGPRDATSAVSPHGRVRVWMNSVLQASHAAGEGSVGGTPLDQNSMAVKELYDAADLLVGHAVILRVGTGIQEEDALYYCKGPVGRCWSPTDTGSAFGAGAPDCAGCHGGLVFTGIPQ